MVNKILQQEHVKAANKAQYWYHTILSTALSPTSGPHPSSLKLVAKDSKHLKSSNRDGRHLSSWPWKLPSWLRFSIPLCREFTEIKRDRDTAKRSDGTCRSQQSVPGLCSRWLLHKQERKYMEIPWNLSALWSSVNPEGGNSVELTWSEHITVLLGPPEQEILSLTRWVTCNSPKFKFFLQWSNATTNDQYLDTEQCDLCKEIVPINLAIALSIPLLEGHKIIKGCKPSYLDIAFPFVLYVVHFFTFYSSLSLIPSTVIDSISFHSLQFHSVLRRFIPFIQSYMLVFNHSFSIDGLMAGWIDWFIDSLMNQLVGWFIDPLIHWFVQQVLVLTSSKANAQWSDINGVLKGCIKIVLFVVLSVILAPKW